MLERIWSNQNTHISLVGSINGRTTLEINRKFLTKLGKCLPAIPLLNIYPKDMKTSIYKKTYTQLSIAALFIIAPTGNN